MCVTNSRYFLGSVSWCFPQSITKECAGCSGEALHSLNPYKVYEDSVHTFLKGNPLVLSKQQKPWHSSGSPRYECPGDWGCASWLGRKDGFACAAQVSTELSSCTIMDNESLVITHRSRCLDNLPPNECNLGQPQSNLDFGKLRENSKSILTFWDWLTKKSPKVISHVVVVDFSAACDS